MHAHSKVQYTICRVREITVEFWVSLTFLILWFRCGFCRNHWITYIELSILFGVSLSIYYGLFKHEQSFMFGVFESIKDYGSQAFLKLYFRPNLGL